MPSGAGFLANIVEPNRLPDWLDADDISSELLAPWQGCVIRQLSLLISGARYEFFHNA